MPPMVLLLFAAFALACLLPLLVSLRHTGTPRGRRETAMALHRAQLAELDRDLAEGRMVQTEHASARLEVQRRLLAAADLPDEGHRLSARLPLIIAALAVPLLAGGLYLIDGHPELPSANALPKADPLARQDDAERLISTLRAKLVLMDPKQEMTAQGYLLLGNAEAGRGNVAAAAAAWRMALEAGFNPALAAQAADAQMQVDGKLTPETRALFERALAEAPPDAMWRDIVKQRLNSGR